MPLAAVIVIVVVVLGIVYLVLRWIFLSPTPSGGGPGSIVTLPPVPAVTIPPGSTASVTPAAITAVNTTGTVVTVKVDRQGINPIQGVPVQVRLTPGSDAGMTSYLDVGPNAAGTGRIVGFGIDGYTDPASSSGAVDLTFKVIATMNGDEDIMTIVVNPNGAVPGLQEKSFTFNYTTSKP